METLDQRPTDAPAAEPKAWPRGKNEIRQPRLLPEVTGANIITRYWQGGYSLGVSYWVFGVLANVAAGLLAFTLSAALSPEKGYEPGVLFAFFVAFWIGLTVLVIWEFVGLWRSARRHADRRIKLGKTSIWAGLAQLTVVLGALQFAAALATNAAPQVRELHAMAFLGDPDIPANSLRLLRGATELDLTGGIKYGLATDLERVLDAAPTVRTIHLTSGGGRIGEAEKVADLIRARGLDTYVPSTCASACTLIFLAGKTRTLFDGARLGFHSTDFPGTSPEDAALADRDYVDQLIAAGVEPGFANRTIAYPPTDMWYPPGDTLLAANVVSRLDDGTTYAISGFGTDPDEADIAASFASIGVYSALEAFDPQAAAEVYAVFTRAYENGNTYVEMITEAQAVMTAAALRSYPLADDDVLVQLNVLLADQHQWLSQQDTAMCYAYSYGGGSPVEIAGRMSPQLRERQLLLNEQSFRTASPREPVNQSAVDALWAKISGYMATTLAPAEYETFTSGLPATTPQQQADYCHAAISMFRLISTLPQHEAALLMRDLLRAL
ncbi:hypothetical protein [Devosia nitrariae]|uniref:Clp protease n=1 Tax=Devosia nitrariae TaxID=2071872 RepID=A0ABQ5W652_9HYPH|nr:hypothetical protein [Devosia nitrariae]GLQ55353.1 hypothetical protein GCM10010862_26120 [Devosia nitrariae]